MLLYIDDAVAGELEGPVPAAPVPVVHPLGPGPAPPHQVPLPRYISRSQIKFLIIVSISGLRDNAPTFCNGASETRRNPKIF